jgi:hypothetical protein
MAHLAGVECKNSLCAVCRKSAPMVAAGSVMTMHGGYVPPRWRERLGPRGR